MRTPRSRRYWLRLIGFALFSFVSLFLCLIVGSTVAIAASYVSPAPSPVVLPSDLPFAVEDVRFTGGDNLTLRGWLAQPRNGVVIILLHGYYGNRLSMRFQAEGLVAAGYGVLMLDSRGSGESDGSIRSYGWADVPDVQAAVDLLKARDYQVGVLGCSIGGQIALRSAASDKDIEAVVADGPSVAAHNDMLPIGSNWDGFRFVYNAAILKWVEIFSGVSMPEPVVDVIDQIALRPLLLIAGANGTELPQIQEYARRAGSTAELWAVPGAHHCDGPQVAPEEYTRRMLAFFDAAWD